MISIQDVHEGDSNISLTKLAVDYKAEEYKHHQWDDSAKEMKETTVYRVTYEGTNFDDIIYWDSETSGSFKSMVGTKFALKDVSTFGILEVLEMTLFMVLLKIVMVDFS